MESNHPASTRTRAPRRRIGHHLASPCTSTSPCFMPNHRPAVKHLMKSVPANANKKTYLKSFPCAIDTRIILLPPAPRRHSTGGETPRQETLHSFRDLPSIQRKSTSSAAHRAGDETPRQFERQPQILVGVETPETIRTTVRVKSFPLSRFPTLLRIGGVHRGRGPPPLSESLSISKSQCQLNHFSPYLSILLPK